MVLMPDYLKTSSIQNSSKPRIISEVKKNCLSKLKLSFTTSFQDNGKTKFSGRLLWNIENSDWVFRTGEVKQGSLILINKETSVIDLKLLLRGLNLLQCNTPRTFCLVEGKGVAFYKFQALNEPDYEKWVKILAVELIRQTPFQNIRFLDILSIIKHKDFDKNSCNILKKGSSSSEECIPKFSEMSRETFEIKCESLIYSNHYNAKEKTPAQFHSEEIKNSPSKDEIIKAEVKIKKSLPDATTLHLRSDKMKPWMRTQSMNNLEIRNETYEESENSSGDENLRNLSFVPVRERKKFFESLNCKKEIQRSESSPLVVKSSNSSSSSSSSSSSNSSSRSGSCIGNTNFLFIGSKLHRKKRTKSLHDLQKTPVREICELFEPKDGLDGKMMLCYGETTEKRGTAASLTEKLIRKGERKLEKLQVQRAEVEENIKIIMDDLKSIQTNSVDRKEGLELYSALRRRLDEEKSRLERLKEEKTKIVKDNLRTINKLEKFNRKR